MTTEAGFEPPSQTSPVNRETLTLGVTYAWNWRDAYYKAFLQLTSSWLLIMAFVITGYLAALAGRVEVAAVLLAATAAISALIVLVEYRRLWAHMQLGKRALIELEKSLADDLNVAALRIAFNRRAELEGRWSAFLPWLLYMGAAVAWSGAAVYALLRT
jgi:hypothetical protein